MITTKEAFIDAKEVSQILGVGMTTVSYTHLCSKFEGKEKCFATAMELPYDAVLSGRFKRFSGGIVYGGIHRRI